MRGTLSLLIGVHNFLWHPFTVTLAWIKLYGYPSFKELVCIFIHDWGYFGKKDMDGKEGNKHPEAGARIAGYLFGKEYHDLCLYHSRHYARDDKKEPSKLCWADKLSIVYETWWFYIPRAWLSGELKEYREIAAKTNFISLKDTNRIWFKWVRARFIILANKKKADVVSYVNPMRD